MKDESNIIVDKKVTDAIKQYQCSGCVCGHDTTCFEKNAIGGIGCGKHFSGTMILGIGKVFLGLPTGFNRLGVDDKLIPNVYNTFEESEWKYDMWNIPTWKYLNENGHTIVRGHVPRRNQTFIHIFLENCIDKIQCLEITERDIEFMD
jgi:hypothetical protein